MYILLHLLFCPFSLPFHLMRNNEQFGGFENNLSRGKKMLGEKKGLRNWILANRKLNYNNNYILFNKGQLP